MFKFRGSWFFRGVLVWFGVMVWFLLSWWGWYRLIENPNKINRGLIDNDNFSLEKTQKAMEEVFSIIQGQYYNTWDIDETKMSRQAISSFVSGLWDPFSSYLPPVESQEFEDEINGDQSIEWIGAILGQNEKGIMVEEVLHSSPAAQAGLRPLDVIVKVNGTWVQSLTVSEVVKQIRWPKGTTVDITLTRTTESGSLDILEKNIVRDTILIPSVSSKILTGLQGQKIGYIWLSIFASDTDIRLKKEIQTLLDAKVQGVILDVRGNGGGLLPESVSVVSHFLPQNSIVTKAKYRIYNDDEYKAEGGDLMSHLPLVVLTNGYSASASEIVALALRENRCKSSIELSTKEEWKGSILSPDCTAILVGQRTFGKGSIQSLQNLTFGWSLKLTVGKRFSPTGQSIHEIGILPDYVVKIDPEQYYSSGIDLQLQKAQELLSQYLGQVR